MSFVDARGSDPSMWDNIAILRQISQHGNLPTSTFTVREKQSVNSTLEDNSDRLSLLESAVSKAVLTR